MLVPTRVPSATSRPTEQALPTVTAAAAQQVILPAIGSIRRDPLCIIDTKVVSGTVNLRVCPGMACEILGYVREDQQVLILSSTPAVNTVDWIQVSVDGRVGWIFSEYLSCTKR